MRRTSEPSTATISIGMDKKDATNRRQRIRKTKPNTFNMNLVRFCFVSTELFPFSGWKFFVKKISSISYEETGNFFGSFSSKLYT